MGIMCLSFRLIIWCYVLVSPWNTRDTQLSVFLLIFPIQLFPTLCMCKHGIYCFVVILGVFFYHNPGRDLVLTLNSLVWGGSPHSMELGIIWVDFDHKCVSSSPDIILQFSLELLMAMESFCALGTESFLETFGRKCPFTVWYAQFTLMGNTGCLPICLCSLWLLVAFFFQHLRGHLNHSLHSCELLPFVLNGIYGPPIMYQSLGM